jgi:hypothetical protein
MEEWSDEIGRINIDYSSEVKIKQELMNCVISTKRPEVYFCGPTVLWYFRAEGSSEWILMRCDYDHQFEMMKGITEYGKPGANLSDEDCLRYVTSIWVNPAQNYASVKITD